MAFPYQQIILSLADSSPVKYLTLTPSRHPKFNGSSDVFDPNAKFTVESATSGGGLVHIRSSNNKYWTSDLPSEVIKSLADKPNEDQSSPQCTLFRAVLQGGNTLRLVHIQSGRNVGRLNQGDLADCLTMQTSNVLPTIFNIINYQSLVKLPKRVAFRSDTGRLLGRVNQDSNRNYNMFVKDDISDILTMYEIVPARNGDIRVKARDVNRFWRLSPNWIWSDSIDSSESNPDIMFEVIKVESNIVALRNRRNNQFCKRYTDEGKVNALAAITPTIDNTARLEVVEPILERSINVLQFRLDEARIYNDSIIIVAMKQALNYTTVQETSKITFSETLIDTSTWNTSISLATGVSFSMTSGIPELGLGSEIKIETTMTESYTWGKERTRERKIEEEYNVPIPPKSKVIVRMLARKGSCDVPFSYSQSDLYIDGERPTPVVMEDGIFSGANAYDFYYETTEEPLSALELDVPQPIVKSVIVLDVPQPVVEEPVSTLDIPLSVTEDPKP